MTSLWPGKLFFYAGRKDMNLLWIASKNKKEYAK